MMSRCPTDTQLLATDRRHVRSCARCQTRLALLSGPVHTVDAPGPDLPSHGALPQVIDALHDPSDYRPRPGQLWRLEFDGTALPAAILEISRDHQDLTVTALGEDPEYADAGTVVIAEADSPLGFAVGIWVTIEHRVPLFTADRYLGELPADLWSQVVDNRHALRNDTPLSGAGAPMAAEIDPRIDYRAGLERSLLDLAQNAWDVVSQEPREAPFRDVLRERGVRPKDLRAIGFSNQELGALSEDRLLLTETELSRLASKAGLDLHELQRLAPRVPRELMIELHTAKRRRQLFEKGLRHGHGPAQERREAARGVVMSGKRTSKSGTEPDWGDALDKWFAQR